MGRGSGGESERSDYRGSKQSRSRSRFDSSPRNVHTEGTRFSNSDTWKPPIPTGPSAKRRPVAQDYFQSASPSSKDSHGNSKACVAPKIKEREPPLAIPAADPGNFSQDSRLMYTDTQPTRDEWQRGDVTQPNPTALGQRRKDACSVQSSVPQQSPPFGAVSEALESSDMDIDVPSRLVQPPKPMAERAGTDTQLRKLDHDNGLLKDNEDERNGKPESDTVRAPLTSSDPRKVDRKDSMSYSTTASGNATPRSSVIDTSISSPGHLRSGEQTPVGPISASFAVPHLPSSAGVVGRGKDPPSDDQKLIMKHLSHFAYCIRQDACLTVQLDAATHKLEKKKREKEKWRQHHESFTSLAEEQDKDMERLKTAMEQITEKRRKYEENRDKSLQTLARALFSINGGSAIPRPENEGKVKQLEMEMKDLRAELYAMRFAMNNPKSDEGHLQEILASQSRLNTELKDLASRSVSLDDHAKLEVKIADLTGETSKIQRISSQNDTLDHQVARIEERVKSLDTLELDASKTKENFGSLNGELQTLKENVKHESKELKGLLVQQEQNSGKCQEAIARFSKDLENATNATADLVTRVISLESLRERDSQKCAQTFSSDVKREVENLSQNVQAITGDLLLLKHDQETKDDLVGQEVERLDAALTGIVGRVESAKKDFDHLSQRVDSIATKVQGIQSQPIKTPASSMQTFTSSVHAPPQAVYGSPYAQSNMLPMQNVINEQRPPPLQDNFKQIIDDHADRLLSCETFILTLQQKYVNLTSDELACSMVRQMQNMYPYASITQAEIKTLKDNIALISINTNQLGIQVAGNTGQVNTMSKSLENHTKELTLVRERRQSEWVELKHLKEKLETSSNELSNKVKNLEEGLTALARNTESSTEAYRGLTARFEAAKAEVDEAVRLLQSGINDISTSFAEVEKATLKDLSSLNAKVTILHDDFRTRSGLKEEGSTSGDATLQDVSTEIVSISDSSEDDIPLRVARVNGRRANPASPPKKSKDTGKRSRGSSEESSFDERKKKKKS
ncbi:MAG: hypothetical protein Q9187_002637 [Circinaria calcarea]